MEACCQTLLLPWVGNSLLSVFLKTLHIDLEGKRNTSSYDGETKKTKTRDGRQATEVSTGYSTYLLLIEILA